MDGPGALKGIHESLTKRPGAQEAWFVVVCASLLAVVLLIHVLVLHVRRRRRAMVNWREFSARLAGWQLSRPESELLRELARGESLLEPLAVAEDVEVFERAVHRYLLPLCSAGGDLRRASRAGQLVAALRRKLALEGRPDILHVSTRQLSVGQRLQLELPDRAAAAQVLGKVGAHREDFLPVTGLDHAEALAKGKQVRVSFFDENRSFAFDARVVEVDKAGASCLITHSIEVKTAGAREFHRVSVEQPVFFRAVWEPADVAREGALRDLSAGGVAFVAPCYYENGERLAVRVAPARLLGERPDGSADDLQERELEGVVVMATRTADERCQYHVEFGDVSARDRRYLLRLVRMLELAGRDRSVRE